MPIVGVSASADGELFASIAEDESAKVFDVVNFGASEDLFFCRPNVLTPPPMQTRTHTHHSDMINMVKLGFTPKSCCWVHRRGQAQSILAVFATSFLPVLVVCS